MKKWDNVRNSKISIGNPPKIIFPDNPQWVEVEIQGNAYCPNCQETTLIVSSIMQGLVAYCPSCFKYFTLIRTND